MKLKINHLKIIILRSVGLFARSEKRACSRRGERENRFSGLCIHVDYWQIQNEQALKRECWNRHQLNDILQGLRLAPFDNIGRFPTRTFLFPSASETT